VFWPMQWMYGSAIRTRLLVGIFTPAIRATDFSPVADLFDRPCASYFGQVSANANTTPFPLSRGPASFGNYPTWIRALLKDSNWFRQPSLCFSSLFRDLFDGFFGSSGSAGRRLADRHFRSPGGRFGGLPDGPGGLFRGLG